MKKMKKVFLCLLFLIPFMTYAQNEGGIIKEICGVKFGSSLNSAKAILEDKFGEADDVMDNVILYLGKRYGGIDFDVIVFSFNKNDSGTYLNQVIFSVLTETKTEAEQEKENIANVIRRQYTLSSKKDSEGNVKYFGGTSPLNSNHYGFKVQSKMGVLFKERYPWEAQLVYGPYGYGEDF